MISLAEKLSILKWSFGLFAVLVLFVIAVSCYKKKRISFVEKAILIFIFFGTVCLIDMYWIEPYWIKTEQVMVHDAALADVLSGVTVVQISDIHLEGGIGYRERELIAKVNAINPDLLFITGDFFSYKQKLELPAELKALTEIIRSFRVTTGIFGVQGNYDHPLRNPAILSEFKSAGIDILFNENRLVALPNHKTLYLAGFDDSQNKRANLFAFRGIPQDVPVVLLAHDPDNFGTAIGAGVNILLAGHTHGGQIGIPFLIHNSHSANKSSFMSGLFGSGETKMYVNQGIGTSGIPIRFFCRPEITVIKVLP
jgi:predicted MPP superfamily phosphohydrolase